MFDQRRAAIAAKAEAAASDARRKVAERVQAIMNSFPKEVQDKFLRYDKEQRERHLLVLQEMNANNQKVRPGLFSHLRPFLSRSSLFSHRLHPFSLVAVVPFLSPSSGAGPPP